MQTDEERRAKKRAITLRWRAANPDRVREHRRKSVLKWRAANPDKVREMHRRWSERNRDKVRQKDIKYRAANPENHRETVRRWSERNPDKVREKSRRSVENVSEAYARGILAKGTSFSSKDFPIELVKLKQAILKTKRELCQLQKTSTNSATNSLTPSNG